MTERKLSESSVTFMIASLHEAHNYLRDTSKRMSDHIQFFLTITSALLAGLFIMLNSQAALAQMILFFTLLCALEAGIGFITFARLISIKVQASIHFARAYRWSQYFLESDNELQRYFAGERMLRKSDIRSTHFPFTRQIILLLRAFAVFNSLMFGLLFLGGIAFLLYIVTSWPPSLLQIVWGTAFACVASVVAAVFSNLYLSSQVRNAQTDFTLILEEDHASVNGKS